MIIVFYGIRNLFAVIGVIVVGALIYEIVSTKIECWGAPNNTAFHQGMTLCPGQSASFTLDPPQ